MICHNSSTVLVNCGHSKIAIPIVSWRRQAWHRLADWLAEPIPFPGQWPDTNQSQVGYNTDVEIAPNVRRSTRSRRLAGSRAR
jgi:hypothetical protein